jgi:hypothetical protein
MIFNLIVTLSLIFFSLFSQEVNLRNIKISNQTLSQVKKVVDSLGLTDRVVYRVKTVSDTGDAIKVVSPSEGPHYPVKTLKPSETLQIFLKLPKNKLAPFISKYNELSEKTGEIQVDEIQVDIEGTTLLCSLNLLEKYLPESKEIGIQNLGIESLTLPELEKVLDSFGISNFCLIVKKITKEDEEIRVVSKDPYYPKDTLKKGEVLSIYLELPKSRLGIFFDEYKKLSPGEQTFSEWVKAEIEGKTLLCPLKLLNKYLPKSPEKVISDSLKIFYLFLFLTFFAGLVLILIIVRFPKKLGASLSKALWGEKPREEKEWKEIKGFQDIQETIGRHQDFIRKGCEKVGGNWEKFEQTLENQILSIFERKASKISEQILKSKELEKMIKDKIEEIRKEEPKIPQKSLTEAYNQALLSRDKALQEEFVKKWQVKRAFPEGERAYKGIAATQDFEYRFREDPSGTFFIVEESGRHFALPDFKTDIFLTATVLNAYNADWDELQTSKEWYIIYPTEVERIGEGLWRLTKMGRIGSKISPEDRLRKIMEKIEKNKDEIDSLRDEIKKIEKISYSLKGKLEETPSKEAKEISSDEIKNWIRNILKEEFTLEIKRMVETEIQKVKEGGVKIEEASFINLIETVERMKEDINSLKESIEKISSEMKSMPKGVEEESIKKLVEEKIAAFEQRVKQELSKETAKEFIKKEEPTLTREEDKEKPTLEMIQYNDCLQKTEREQKEFLEINKAIEVTKEKGSDYYIPQKNGPLILIQSPSLLPDEFFVFPNFTSEPDDVVSIYNLPKKGLKKGKWKIKKPAIAKKISENKWEISRKGEIIER